MKDQETQGALNRGRRTSFTRAAESSKATLPGAKSNCAVPCHSGNDTTAMRNHQYDMSTGGISKSDEFAKKMLAAFAVNVGLRCGHDCTYCSARASLRCHDAFQELGERAFGVGYSIVDPNIVEKVARDAAGMRNPGLVQICTTVDAWAPEAQALDLGRRCLEAVLEQPGWTVRVLTKNAAVAEEFGLIRKYKDRVLIGLSLTGTRDKQDALSVIEPHASPISERMAALRKAHKMGLRTFGMLCPLLPAIADAPEQVDELVQFVKACGAEGVGLFRTEYLFLNRDRLPGEEQQYQAYREVAAALKPLPVIIRTLDLGGDKFLAHMQMPTELNPFLGWRAIRISLQERDIFRAQLRAILRASAEGNLKMMYPMISSLDELKQANELVEEYKAELRRENIPFDEHIEIGAMIETPSAAMVADSLAKRVKFFSIGTNDLIQYSLAVDRMNEKIAHLYEPTHPAIVRLIKMIVDAAHNHGVRVSVCGEMGGDAVLTPLLLGLGVDELSAAPPLVPQIKFIIRRLKLSEAKELAAFALNCEAASEILARCQDLARQIAPSLFETK